MISAESSSLHAVALKSFCAVHTLPTIIDLPDMAHNQQTDV